MTPIASILAPWSLALIAAPAPPPWSPGDAARIERERELARAVDPERMRQRVRDLVALGPRMGGTESGAKAVDSLARAFGEIGLDVRVVEAPERWCHEERGFRVVARKLGEPSEELVLERAWPYGFSPSAKGVATLSLEAREGVALLAPRHARNRKDSTKLALELVDGAATLDGSYPVVHHLRDGDANPHPVFGLSKPEGERLRAWLASGARVEIAYELDALMRKAKPRTAVARLRGAAEGDAWARPHVLVCAHGDSDAGGPGANDNASGVAITLEIARVWRAAIERGALAPPTVDVRFAIWGTEIHSTRAYLEQCIAEGGEPLAVLNFDQSGFGSSLDQLNLEPDDLERNAPLARALIGVLEDHAGAEGFPACWATNKSLGGTDSYVFSDSELFRERSRPSLTIFTSAWGSPAEHPRTQGMPGESCRDRDVVALDYDNYYHSAGAPPENTTDKEPFNMGWCARVAWLGALRHLEGLR